MLEENNPEKLFHQFKEGGVQFIYGLKELEAKESEILDFKRAQNNCPPPGTRDKENLSKAISGFANGDGGVLVWGVDCAGEKDCVTGFSEIDKVDEFRKNIFNQCNQLAKPRVRGIKAVTIYADDSKQKGFVVMLIPKSKYIVEGIAKSSKHFSKGYYERSLASFVEISDERLRDRLLQPYKLRPAFAVIACTLTIIAASVLWTHFANPPTPWKNKHPTNLAEAKQLYEPYAATDAEAQVRLGCAYYFLGDASESNRSRYVHWFEEAAKRNNPLAQYNLATLYVQRKIPIAEDKRLLVARDLYAKAHASKFFPASIQLAVINTRLQEMSFRAPVEKKLSSAKKAAHMLPVINESIGACTSAQDVGGQGYLCAARLVRFKTFLNQAASTNANFIDTPTIGLNESHEFYEKSYELGCSEAAYNLFVLFSFNNQSLEAHQWLINATKPSLGPVSPIALTALGQAYEHGDYGFQQDRTEAYRLYGNAAARNYPPAIFKYAKFLQESNGDLEHAIELYKWITARFASHKYLYSAAANNLGVAYWKQAQKTKGRITTELEAQLEMNANKLIASSCEALAPSIPRVNLENLTYIFTMKPCLNFTGTRFLLPAPVTTGLQLIDFDDDFPNVVVSPFYLGDLEDLSLLLPPDLEHLSFSNKPPSLPTNHP